MEVTTTTVGATKTTAAATDGSLTTAGLAIRGERHARRSPRFARTEPGFVLLEVLIAAAIAALALGVMVHAGLTGVLAAQTASHYEQAVVRARSHLTMAASASPLVAGDWQGDDGGGFTWHLRVVPIASTAVQPVTAFTRAASASFPLTLYSVSVSIAWHDGGAPRRVELDTQQIGQGAR